ncbi:MAG: hypothetical protein JNL80_17390 [Phycisphaerae bacterium]|jgi:hypothetical protein|nr:hypothetical protein [Phycisphaerae bacterium]
MPRWSLVVLSVGAVLLAVLPFDWVPGSYELGARWVAAIALGTGAVVAGQQNSALWCGVFAASAVIFQPLLPIDLKDYALYVHVSVAILTAICVVRHW